MFLIDAHLDMAMNAIEWNRDYRKSVFEIRAREQGMTDKVDRGKGVVSLPQLREGNIGLVVATQIARYVAPSSTLTGWNSPEIAWAMTQAQLAWYNAMEELGEMVQINDAVGLERHLALWLDETLPNSNKPVGYILSLEGADSLINLSYLEKAYSLGLRACGPAHYGIGRYAAGTTATGSLTHLGRDLLREMDNLRMILDVTHFTDEGFWEALALYKGPVWASHHNCRSLVSGQRQITDDQIKALTERGGVIGGVFDAWMLANNWQRGIDDPKERNVCLESVVAHFDHICQLTGNVNHVAIGSDLDGCYGKEQSPYDLETIADLQMLTGILERRGYKTTDIEQIFYKNWLRFLQNAWTP
jgi:membrane dipeptidase